MFIVLIAAGCKIFEKRESQWSELDRTNDVYCDPWKFPQSVLKIDNLKVIDGKQKSFYMEGKDRNGSDIAYTGIFPQDFDLEIAEYSKIGAGPQVEWLGGSHGFWSLLEITEDAAKGQEIQKIILKTNTHQETIRPLLLNNEIEGISFVSDSENYWFVLQNKESSFELWELKFSNDHMTYSRNITATGIRHEPFPLKNRDSGESYIVFLQQSSGKEAFKSSEAKFTEDEQDRYIEGEESYTEIEESLIVQKIGDNGKLETSFNLTNIPMLNVENWSILSKSWGFYLAVIHGDSIVGEAALDIFAYKWEKGTYKLQWKKSTNLPNVHLGDLQWAAGSEVDYLYLLKWLDAESTIVSYKMSDKRFLSATNSGVFPKGSALIEAFQSSVGDSKKWTFGVLRYKNGLNWNYDLCKIDET